MNSYGAAVLQALSGAINGPAAAKIGETLGLGAVGLAVIAALTACLFVKLGCIAASLWFMSVCPEFSARVRKTYRSHSLKSFFFGVIALFLLLFFAAVMAKIKPLAILGVLLLLLLAALIIIGRGAAYQNLGLRLRGGEKDTGVSCPIPHILGGLTVEASCYIPIFGQLLSACVTLRGLGAIVLAMLSQQEAPQSGEV